MARGYLKSAGVERLGRRVRRPRAGALLWRILIGALLLLPAAALAQDIKLEIPSTALTTSTCRTHEERGNCPLNVSLTSKPTANVTVQLTSADTTVATVSPATLIFTPQNYADQQSVAITGVDDEYRNDINGRHRKTTVSFAASGGNYQGITKTVTVTVLDDEPSRDITVRGYDVIQEGGETLQWRLTLRTKPTGTVTVTVTQSAGPKVIDLEGNALTFTPSNWNQQQVVKLIPRDDDSRNKQYRQRLQFTLAAKGQGDYDGYSTTHRLYFYDDEPVPYEADEGTERKVRVRVEVCEAPHDRETWDITSSDPDVVGVSPGRLVWTSQNTGTIQPFILTFHENNGLGDGFARISMKITTSCPKVKIHRLWDYTVRDNDTGSVIIGRTEVSVGVGRGVGYSVALSARPSGLVTVTASSDATGFATVHSGQQEGGESVSLEFGQRNWDQPQYVSVFGQNAGSATISHTVTGGGYDGVEVDSVAVTVSNRDIFPDDDDDDDGDDFDNDDDDDDGDDDDDDGDDFDNDGGDNGGPPPARAASLPPRPSP